MTIEEELLYYFKRAVFLREKLAQQKGEPSNEEEDKEDRKFIDLIKEVIESRKEASTSMTTSTSIRKS